MNDGQQQEKQGNTTQAIWLGIGSFTSFGFAIISTAILSRFLPKEDYGTYRQVMYVYSTLLTVFTLGLPRAYSYFLPRVRIETGLSLVKKLNRAFLLLGLIFSLVLFWGAEGIALVLNNPDLTTAIKIFSPSPFFLLPTMGLEGVLATYKKTQWNAIYTILSRILMILFVAVPVVMYKQNSVTALWGFTISSALSYICSLIFFRLPFKGTCKEKSDISYLQILKFSLPLMFAGFWGIAERSADQFYVSRFFGQSVFAEFSNGCFELPFVGMILGAGATVLLPVFSRMVANGVDKKSLLELWKRTSVKAAYIIYPMVIYCWAFSETIMTFLYGEQYENSAVYFRIMIVVNLFTIAQYAPILLALGKTKFYANVHLYIALATWIFEYLVVIVFEDALSVAIVSAVCRIVKIFLLMSLIAKYMGVSVYRLFPVSLLIKILVSCIISVLMAKLIVQITPSNNIELFALIEGLVVFCIGILLLGKLLRINYFEIIEPVLVKLKKR